MKKKLIGYVNAKGFVSMKKLDAVIKSFEGLKASCDSAISRVKSDPAIIEAKGVLLKPLIAAQKVLAKQLAYFKKQKATLLAMNISDFARVEKALDRHFAKTKKTKEVDKKDTGSRPTARN